MITFISLLGNFLILPKKVFCLVDEQKQHSETKHRCLICSLQPLHIASSFQTRIYARKAFVDNGDADYAADVTPRQLVALGKKYNITYDLPKSGNCNSVEASEANVLIDCGYCLPANIRVQRHNLLQPETKIIL